MIEDVWQVVKHHSKNPPEVVVKKIIKLFMWMKFETNGDEICLDLSAVGPFHVVIFIQNLSSLQKGFAPIVALSI